MQLHAKKIIHTAVRDEMELGNSGAEPAAASATHNTDQKARHRWLAARHVACHTCSHFRLSRYICLLVTRIQKYLWEQAKLAV